MMALQAANGFLEMKNYKMCALRFFDMELELATASKKH